VEQSLRHTEGNALHSHEENLAQPFPSHKCPLTYNTS